MFPTIRNISDVLLHLKDKPEFSVYRHPNGFTSICYNITGPDTFSNNILRECRGIVFDQDGQIVARPFHKFFNVGERPETQTSAIDWSDIVSVEPKLDGSMIYFVKGKNGQWYPKTKKSFVSDSAKAVAALDVYQNGSVSRLLDAIGTDNTAIFEYVAPSNQIVVRYDVPQLVLLGIRNNVDGYYWTTADIHEIAKSAGWKSDDIVQPVHLTSGPDLIDVAKKYPDLGIEGWVLVRSDGERYKLKTLKYLQVHRAIAHLEPIHILKAWADGTIDDVRSLLEMSGMDEQVKKIDIVTKEATQKYDDIVVTVRSIVASFPTEKNAGIFKKAAFDYAKHPLFSLIMTELRGRSPDYRKVVLENMAKKNNETATKREDD